MTTKVSTALDGQFAGAWRRRVPCATPYRRFVSCQLARAEDFLSLGQSESSAVVDKIGIAR